jgi:hypothetical protein
MLFIFSTPELIRNLGQLKTAFFPHRCLICAVPLLSLKPGNFFQFCLEFSLKTNTQYSKGYKSWMLSLFTCVIILYITVKETCRSIFSLWLECPKRLIHCINDIREYITCSLAQPACLVLVEYLYCQPLLSCCTTIRCKTKILLYEHLIFLM